MTAKRVPGCLLLGVFASFTNAEAQEPAFFEAKVGPVLQRRCFECHSHQKQMKGGLTLDSKSGWEQGGDTGPAIVPGRPDESLLIKMVRRVDGDHQMPPKEALPAEEVAVLEEWVRRGAPDPRVLKRPGAPDWWSLKPLAKPAVPATGDAGTQHPVDRFIRARLAEKKIEPSPEADRRTLIRRLFFDLHGLPPSFEEVDAFARDDDPLAYDRLVDRLLASPRYGERWARHWLDTIHFAETHGFEHDLPRDHAWRYRDYVIAAFNNGTPWPRFIREQLAADRFFPGEPRLTPALGFLGAGTFDHSSFTTAPVTFDYLDRDDLVTQTMAAFASTTANCARCHAHKFDPVTQEDYYALQAVFAGIVKGNIPFDDDRKVAAERQRWRAMLAAADAGDRALLLDPAHGPVIRAWVAGQNAPAMWEPLSVVELTSTGGSTLARESDGAISSSGARPEKDTCIVTASSALPRITALRLEVLSHPSLPKGGPGRQDNGNLHLSEFEVGPGAGPPLKIRRATADFNQEGWDITRAVDGKPGTAWGIYPEVGKAHQAVFELATPLALRAGERLTITMKQLHGQGHLIGRFRLSATASDAPSVSLLPAAVAGALRLPEAQRTEAHKLAIAAEAMRAHANDRLASLPPPSLVFAAGGSADVLLAVGKGTPRTIDRPKTVNVLKRGDFARPLAEARPGALSAITALKGRFDLPDPDDEAARRAALADWLADEDNPLTWRSIANRVWHYHFGRGLCDTPSDFGRMGGAPSHPELLDWLAHELRASGGSLKHLHRLIVSSAAYRQSSAHRDDAAKLDADNRLLWRQNRHRLDADAYRDFVLAGAGRLDLAMGGPGERQFVEGKPVQLTPTVDYAAYDWEKTRTHRRSIYRFVWRGIPDPFMEALDFPDLGLLSPSRGFSASSLQALSLYNNSFALHLSARIADAAGSPGAAVRRLLLREPAADEQREFAAFAQQHGLAALCRVLINSNEFLFVN